MSTRPDEGFPRPLKLRLIEAVGFVLLLAGAALLVLGGSWERGVGLLALGSFVMLMPEQLARLLDRFLPGG